ncbi:MAG TPA: hypothetical protein DIT18_17520 [Pseudomonas sp.]|nr:hypothetical protein [Pseudomonas sp.]
MSNQKQSLHGEVFFEHRVSVPETATLSIRLLDVSIPDLDYPIIDEQQELVGDRGSPFPFHLTYDPEQLDPRHHYAIRGQITYENRFLFLNIAMQSVKLDGSDPQPLLIRLDKVQ